MYRTPKMANCVISTCGFCSEKKWQSAKYSETGNLRVKGEGGMLCAGLKSEGAPTEVIQPCEREEAET